MLLSILVVLNKLENICKIHECWGNLLRVWSGNYRHVRHVVLTVFYWLEVSLTSTLHRFAFVVRSYISALADLQEKSEPFKVNSFSFTPCRIQYVSLACFNLICFYWEISMLSNIEFLLFWGTLKLNPPNEKTWRFNNFKTKQWM